MEMEENKYEPKSGNNSSKTVLLILLFLVVGIAGYLFYGNSKKADEIITKDETIKTAADSLAGKVKELQNLQEAYTIMKKERELLGLNNDELNKEIKKINEYLAAVKS